MHMTTAHKDNAKQGYAYILICGFGIHLKKSICRRARRGSTCTPNCNILQKIGKLKICNF